MKRFFISTAILLSSISCESNDSSTSTKTHPVYELENIQQSNIPMLEGTTSIEGSAYDSRTSKFYVGAFSGSDAGAIYTIASDNKVEEFQKAGIDDRNIALGMKIDEQRDRLWISAFSSIQIYDISENKLINQLNYADLGLEGDVLINDMIIDKDGDAYVTNTLNNHILKATNTGTDDAPKFEMEVFVDTIGSIPSEPVNDLPYLLNGLALSPDGNYLISVQYNDGSLWKIDINTKEITKVPTSEALLGGDGVIWTEKNVIMVVAQLNSEVYYFSMSDEPNSDGVYDLTKMNISDLSGAATIAYISGESPSILIPNTQAGVDAADLQQGWATKISFEYSEVKK